MFRTKKLTDIIVDEEKSIFKKMGPHGYVKKLRNDGIYGKIPECEIDTAISRYYSIRVNNQPLGLFAKIKNQFNSNKRDAALYAVGAINRVIELYTDALKQEPQTNLASPEELKTTLQKYFNEEYDF